MPPRKNRPDPFNTTNDARYSKAAVAQIGELRGGMVAAAEKFGLPDRFIAERHAHRPAIVLLDQETGRTSVVPLFAYGAVREMLNDLYGPAQATLEEVFDEKGLDTEIEFGSMEGKAAWSPLIKRVACYVLDIPGVEAGELGIGRIEMRDDGLFHLLDTNDHIGAFETLEHALFKAEDEIVPNYAPGRRP